jgi:hypothetical protein
MKLKRRLTWDTATGMFVSDDQANALRGRKARKPEYDFRLALSQASVAWGASPHSPVAAGLWPAVEPGVPPGGRKRGQRMGAG